jgi:hypothetical protein
MTPFQNLYLTLWNFGAAVALAAMKTWWVGVLAFALTVLTSLALSHLLPWARLSPERTIAWAWIKPPLVAIVVFVRCWSAF